MSSTFPFGPEELAAVRRGLLAVMPIGVVLIDAGGHILETNPAAHALLYLREQPDALRITS